MSVVSERGDLACVERASLVLRIWERLPDASTLQAFVNAVADELASSIDLQGLWAFGFEPEARFRLLASWNAHSPGIPDENGEGFHCRMPDEGGNRSSARERLRSGADLLAWITAGECVACADLLTKEGWYEFEFALAADGMRSYVSVPVFGAGQLSGMVVFSRWGAGPFTLGDTAILTRVARAFGIAIARVTVHTDVQPLPARLGDEPRAVEVRFGHAPFFQNIVGTSLSLRRAIEAIEQVASTDATVLITGETGTGKELFARGLHQRSSRHAKPFVELHCAAIPETLLAAELFGHERGAFTGADQRRQGRFEQADGGTLFLDEIGELSPEMQVLLLRVLQMRAFQRLGGVTPIRVDVRVVAATNRSLTEEVAAGRFRPDLFYRLNVFPVRVPALRERPEDIGMLTTHLAAKYADQFGRPISRIDRRTLTMLESYAWPGNVRELENVVARAVIVSAGEVLHIPADMLAGTAADEQLTVRLDQHQREAIEAALCASRGRVAGAKGAARRLGLAPSTLESRITRLGIDKHRYRQR